MTDIFSNINFYSGKLSNHKAQIFLDVPLEDQKYNLFEDILQVIYKNKDLQYILDIGWYGGDFEISENSFFNVRIITDENWSDAIYDKKTNNLNELKTLIEEAIAYILLCSKKNIRPFSN